MEKKNSNKFITDSQFIILLISSMIGVGIFSLPNDVLKYAKQDGWLTCIVGALYPIIIVLIASYLCKLRPDENIYALSKQAFGKFIGTILNGIFTMYFLLAGTAIASGMNNVLIIHIVPFLTSPKLLMVFFLPPAFIAYKGLKTVSRVSEIVFYLTIILFFVPFAAIRSGLIYNVMPIFGSGFINILKSSKDTAFAYTGIEVIYILYPFIKNNKKIVKNSIIGVSSTVLIYTWFTFITIYYLGVDIIPKFIWSTLTVTHPLAISIINNFKSIFMVLWTSIMFKIVSIFYYGFSFSLNSLFSKIPRTTYIFLSYPLFFYISLKYGGPTSRGYFLDKIMPVYVIFNILYGLSIALIITIKDGRKKNE